MADIRRPTADINPVNYIRPGVQDNSTAALIEGATELGAAGFEIDKRLAKKRFGEALEVLRSQAITEEAPDFGDADPDVGVALAGVDKSSLKDFEKVLSQQDGAVTQGRMSREQFRIRAERLYRVAISKRPGLANEFRQVAANYLGMDVVGATVDELFKLREEQEAAAAAKVKTAQEMLIESQKYQRDEYVKMRIPGAQAIIPGTPQAAEFLAANVGLYAERQAAAAKLAITQQVVDQSKADGTLNQSANAANYLARVGVLVQEFPIEIDKGIAELEAAGLLNDPNAVEALAMSVISKYDNAVGELDAAFTDDELSSEFKAIQRQRFSFIKDRLMNIISGERNEKFASNLLSILRTNAQMAVMENSELAMASTISDMFPGEAFERIMKDITPRLSMVIGELVQDKGSVESNTANAAPAVATTIGAVWPRMGAQPDPQALESGVKTINRALTSFFLADSVHFKPGNYSKDGTKEGVLAHLNNHEKVIVPTLSEQHKADLASAIAGSAANSVRIMAQRLYAKAPGIRGKLDRKFFVPDGKNRVFKPVKGASLSKLEQSALDEFNRQANVPLITDTLKAYGGFKTQTEAWQYIAALYPDVLEAQKQAKTDKPEEREPENEYGLKIGHRENGWYYMGGDPGMPSSWSKTK